MLDAIALPLHLIAGQNVPPALSAGARMLVLRCGWPRECVLRVSGLLRVRFVSCPPSSTPSFLAGWVHLRHPLFAPDTPFPGIQYSG